MNMDVLWFVNKPITPTMVEAHKNSGTGGWLEGLASIVCADVTLSVAYVDPYGPAEIKSDFLTCYAIRPRAWRTRLLARSLFNVGHDDGPILDQAREIVEKVRPDLIDIHGTEKAFGGLMPEARSKGIPVLLTLQGILGSFQRHIQGGYDDLFLRTFFYDYGGSLQSLFPKRVANHKRHVQKQAIREHLYIRQAEFISGRTQWDRRISMLINPPCHYFHVDRALRTDFYKNRWLSPNPSEPFRVHTTLGDSLMKGFDVLAEAAALLDENDIPVEWSIAGISSSSMSVKAARKKMGVRFPDRSFQLCGRLNPESLIRKMCEAHVYVMASYMENSPNNLAEAMCLGMPCVATLAGGSGSYIRDGEDGILVQPGDPLGLAGAIAQLKNDPGFARALGECARERALKRHSPELVKKQLLGAYKEILASKQESEMPRPVV